MRSLRGKHKHRWSPWRGVPPKIPLHRECLECGEVSGTLQREQSREEMRQILVWWNTAQLERLQEVANAILDDAAAAVSPPPEERPE